MNLIVVIQKFIEVTKIESKEIFVLLVFLFLFIWLYKAFKSQYNKKIELESTNYNQMRMYISNSLSLANQYKIDSSKGQEFFISIFNCYPFMKPNEIEYIQGILDDKSLRDKKKIEGIEKNLYKKLIYLSSDNKDSNDVKFIMEWIEYIFIRFRHPFIPVIQTILTFFGLITFFIIVLSIGGSYIRLLIFIVLLIIIIAILSTIDLVLKRNVKSFKF